MKFIDLKEFEQFEPNKPHRELLYDSPNLRVLSFNFEPGQEMPVHCHEADSDVSLLVLEGEGEFLGTHAMPAKAGTLQVVSVCDPHGFRAASRVRLLVCIAPTL